MQDNIGSSSDRVTSGHQGLLMSRRAERVRRAAGMLGHATLLLVTSSSMLAVLFIFYFITKDALPFFRMEGIREFFTQVAWYPTEEPPAFGALAIFYGTAMVTIGSIIVAVPLGLSASLCLSDILPFSIRQLVKPVIELLAAIPSVAYGFVAMVVLAPMLQDHGGRVLSIAAWIIGTPLALLSVVVLSDVASHSLPQWFRSFLLGASNIASAVRRKTRHTVFDCRPNRLVTGMLLATRRNSKQSIGPSSIIRITVGLILTVVVFFGLAALSRLLGEIKIVTGVNAFNASLILGIMALPTIVSVSEDALQAVGRDLREGSYALGATRAETLVKVVIPAASSGICAAVILGIMRAVGETMVVLMAAGGASHIPSTWYDFFASVRTLTATIVAEMGEADQTTGSAHYHALFAMALSLLAISFLLNMLSEWAVYRERKKLRGE